MFIFENEISLPEQHNMEQFLVDFNYNFVTTNRHLILIFRYIIKEVLTKTFTQHKRRKLVPCFIH